MVVRMFMCVVMSVVMAMIVALTEGSQFSVQGVVEAGQANGIQTVQRALCLADGNCRSLDAVGSDPFTQKR